MRTFLLLTFALAFVPLLSHGQSINAGFVEGLWYSKEPVFVNEPVRIYAALRNNTESDLTGTVVFKDGDNVIETRDISALSGRIVETWADAIFDYGDHTISATLTNVTLHTVGETPEEVTASHSLSEQILFVDEDTDGDGIGNATDGDDDNDGYSDSDEEVNGTNPLIQDEPPEEETASSSEPVEEEVEEEVADTNEKEGLEKYLDDGAVKNTLSRVTDTVTNSKRSIDTYREKRNEARQDLTGIEELEQELGTTTEAGEALATITRSRIEPEKKGFVATFIEGIVGIFSGLYTFLLFIVSKLLAYPGLIQVLLLFGILFGVIKTARRLSSRGQ